MKNKLFGRGIDVVNYGGWGCSVTILVIENASSSSSVRIEKGIDGEFRLI